MTGISDAVLAVLDDHTTEEFRVERQVYKDNRADGWRVQGNYWSSTTDWTPVEGDTDE